MCLRSERARSMSWNSNIKGVRTSEADTSMARRSAAWSTLSAKSRRAVSILLREVFVIGPRTCMRRSAVRKVPSSVSAIGRSCCTPADRRAMVSGMG